jgi:uncharacterized membrane protein YhhN
MKNSKIILLVFWAVLALHLLAIYMNMPLIRVISKCALLPLLLLYLMVAGSGHHQPVFKKLAMLALFFSWLGDILLTQDGTIFFLMGMGAFIVTHLINGGLLLRLQSVRFTFATMMGVILALGAIGMVYYWLHDFLGTFSIPVVLYMFIIGSVLVLAFNVSNNTRYKNIAYTCFIPGMFLFTVSDSLLALNKFLFHNPTGWDIWIMLTYALAQWLLTEGYISVVNGDREESNP